MKKKRMPLFLFATLLLSGGPALGQRSMEQDPSLNNLIHPPDYRPAAPDTFGHVEKRGRGPVPMVLVPGGGFSWTVFEEFMQRHESEYTMYAVSLAGMGGTAAPPMPPAGTSYGEQTWIKGAIHALRNLIRSENLDRPVVVGHFLEGTHIALRMAIDHPEMVRAVIILGGAAKFAGPQSATYTLEQRIRYLDDSMAPNWFKTVTLKTWNDNNFPASSYSRRPEEADELYREVSQGPLQIFIRYLLEFWAADPTLEFGSVTRPVLVLMPSFSEEYVKELQAPWLNHYFVNSWDSAKSNPLIRTKAIPDARIFVWIDQPERVDQEISDFLQELDQ